MLALPLVGRAEGWRRLVWVSLHSRLASQHAVHAILCFTPPCIQTRQPAPLTRSLQQCCAYTGLQMPPQAPLQSCLDCDLMASLKYSTVCGSFMSAMNMTLRGKHVSTRVVLLLSCAQSVGLPALQGIDTSCEQSLPAEPLLLGRPTNSPQPRQLPSQNVSDGKGRECREPLRHVCSLVCFQRGQHCR